MSRERGVGVLNSKSRANRREAPDRPTSFKAAYVVEARSQLEFRVGSGNPQLWCRKLDTLTFKQESSVRRWG